MRKSDKRNAARERDAASDKAARATELQQDSARFDDDGGAPEGGR